MVSLIDPGDFLMPAGLRRREADVKLMFRVSDKRQIVGFQENSRMFDGHCMPCVASMRNYESDCYNVCKISHALQSALKERSRKRTQPHKNVELQLLLVASGFSPKGAKRAGCVANFFFFFALVMFHFLSWILNELILRFVVSRNIRNGQT